MVNGPLGLKGAFAGDFAGSGAAVMVAPEAGVLHRWWFILGVLRPWKKGILGL